MKPENIIIPLELVDQILQDLNPQAVTIFLFIWRKTQGWNKESDKISYSQIKAVTGIKHRRTIKNAIDDIAKIISVTPGHGRSNMYEFDISAFYQVFEPDLKGSPNEPFTHSDINTRSEKGAQNEPLPEPKGSKSEPLIPQTVHQMNILPIKGSPNEHTSLNTISNLSNDKLDTPPVKKSKSRKRNKSDPRTQHPAIQEFKHQMERYPTKNVYDEIIEAVGDQPEKVKRWGEVVRAWKLCPYSPQNYLGMLDCFNRGVLPDPKGNTNGRKPTQANRKQYYFEQSNPTFDPTDPEQWDREFRT